MEEERIQQNQLKLLTNDTQKCLAIALGLGHVYNRNVKKNGSF